MPEHVLILLGCSIVFGLVIRLIDFLVGDDEPTTEDHDYDKKPPSTNWHHPNTAHGQYMRQQEQARFRDWEHRTLRKRGYRRTSYLDQS